jgi:hypothetical protein
VLLARACNRLIRYAETTTEDPDVLRRRRLLLDFDAKRPKGIAATDQEVLASVTRRNEGIAFLRELGWPALMLALSGNGAHALPAIDLANTPESEALVKQVLAALADRFSDNVVEFDTTVSNASRLTKLYGTVNVKGDATPDRPHRRTVLESIPDEDIEVTDAQLREVAALAPSPRRTYSVPSALNGRGAFPPQDDGLLGPLAPAVEGCDFLRWCRDHQANVAEPLWYALLSNLVRLDGGRAAAHAFSRGHPGYSAAETDQKLDHALAASGPISCAKIQELGFTGCPPAGHGVKSPTGLAWTRPAAAPPAAAEREFRRAIDVLGDPPRWK